MPLPGQVSVSDEFKVSPRDQKGLRRTRLEEKRNLTRSDNPADFKPGVPDWLQISHPFEAIANRENTYASRIREQGRSVDDLGTSANSAVASGVEYRRREAAAKALAQAQARAERNAEFMNGLGNTDFNFGDVDANGKRGDVINAARRLLNVPYSWGGGHGGSPGPSYGIAQGANIKGVDCSGLVRYAFAKAGIKQWGKNAVSQTQSLYGKRASIGSLLPGDLVVKGTPGSSYHIAIYIGNGKIIEAQKTGTRVHIRSIKGESWIGVHLNY